MSHCVDDLVSRANDCFNWMLHTRPLNHLQGEKAQHNDSAHQNWTYMNSIPMFIAPLIGIAIIAQCVNLEHEFHHDASKVRIFRFEPFNQSLMIRIPLRCFRIPHRLTSTLTYKL